MRRASKLWLVPFVAAVSAFLVLPALVVVPMSFTEGAMLRFPPRGFSWQWYEEFLTSSAWRRAISNSVKIAVLTTVAATSLGTMAALGLVRGRLKARRAANLIVLAPMIVPYVVTALALFAVFLRWGLVGSTAGLVIAHTCLALPFVVVNVTAVLERFDRDLEFAALSLGASPWNAFWTITLPIIRPGVLAGALFAFITSFDEVVVAIFLTSPALQTLPVQMWSGARQELRPTLAAVSTALIVLSIIIVALAARFWMVPKEQRT